MAVIDLWNISELKHGRDLVNTFRALLDTCPELLVQSAVRDVANMSDTEIMQYMIQCNASEN